MSDIAGSKLDLLYVTDIERTPAGGGAYAVNYRIQEELEKRVSLDSPPPVVPRVSTVSKWWSRFLRYGLHRPSAFFYFSEVTLASNAARVAQLIRPETDAILFRSATRWSSCRPDRPYFVYLDVVFRTFFDNTFQAGDFIESDIDRICRREAEFLEGAKAVFFESRWGMEKAIESYGLKGNHYFAPGRAGNVFPPSGPTKFEGQRRLLSIATHFHRKGGDLVFEAFRELRESYPDLCWHIIGADPGTSISNFPGIVWEGKLDIDQPADKERLESLLSSAFLLLHPTREDTNPLVITEAACFSCPSVSVNRFAIPELIVDGETGILITYPPNSNALAQAVKALIEDPERYQQMRAAAYDHAIENFSWPRIAASMVDTILEAKP